MEKKVLIINHGDFDWASPRLLGAAGYSVVLAQNPDVGLKKLTERCDLVILSDALAADSWQLCERIRRISALPIIVISPEASVETSVRTIKAGADYFLRKPFGPLEFLARVQSLLRRSSRN